MTEYCVDTTCRAAIARGFDVELITDGHATVDGALDADAVIAHHNRTLDGFEAASRRITTTTVDHILGRTANTTAVPRKSSHSSVNQDRPT